MRRNKFKTAPILEVDIEYYPRIAFKSASGVLIGLMPNLSTSTFITLDEKKAGTEGPI